MRRKNINSHRQIIISGPVVAQDQAMKAHVMRTVTGQPTPSQQKMKTLTLRWKIIPTMKSSKLYTSNISQGC